MEIYSILLQSTNPTQPGKVFLTTTLAPNFNQALMNATHKAIESNGDLNWKFIVHNTLPVQTAPIVKAPEVKPQQDTAKMTENWVMATIIKNKDSTLFEVCKQYLTEPEILYITSKLNNEENISRE